MITAMMNLPSMQESVLVIVIERDNLERMKTGDPATLESIHKGGVLIPPQYPQRFSVLVAYEEDDAELYRRVKGDLGELMVWLERGRKFIEGLDGKENAFSFRKEKQP